MYVYCIERYVYCIYSTYIFHRSLCPSKGEGLNLLTPLKYTVLNWNSVFDLCKIFHEHNPGIKDLPVYKI